MKRILCLLMCIPLIVHAQNEQKGIHFENGLSWQQIKSKAWTENKYIFVDCYATWCGPCKAMDKNVYPKDSLGDYMNDKFISVKVQFDSSKQDDEEVKKWYADAKDMMQKFD